VCELILVVQAAAGMQQQADFKELQHDNALLGILLALWEASCIRFLGLS
jgi:hypothetical protein